MRGNVQKKTQTTQIYVLFIEIHRSGIAIIDRKGLHDHTEIKNTALHCSFSVETCSRRVWQRINAMKWWNFTCFFASTICVFEARCYLFYYLQNERNCIRRRWGAQTLSRSCSFILLILRFYCAKQKMMSFYASIQLLTFFRPCIVIRPSIAVSTTCMAARYSIITSISIDPLLRYHCSKG